ncbi:MAG: site-specific integrase [Bacteroidota bacterium]
MITTTAIILDTRRATKDNKYPLKLRVTFQRRRKYYGTQYKLTLDEWDKVNGKKPHNDYKEIRNQTNKIVEEADAVIKKMESFSFDLFEKQYFKKASVRDISTAFQNYIDKLNEQSRISTAISYRCAKNSLAKFKNEFLFQEITPDLLRKYESWMLSKGKSTTSVGFYLRSLRTIVNEAMKEGVIKAEQYPFGKGKYQIPTGQNIKKALTIKEVQQIISFETVPGTAEDKARDLWILSYMCNGVNMKDICRWKYKNLKGDKITFYRAKTERTSRNPKPIVIILTDKAKKIICKWSNKRKSDETYIFPFLNDINDPIREKKAVEQVVKTTNKYMVRMAKDLGIETNLTTYVARHTFSTILKRGGVPIAFISESLGHSDLRTTENYLGSFEDEQKRAFARLLIPEK